MKLSDWAANIQYHPIMWIINAAVHTHCAGRGWQADAMTSIGMSSREREKLSPGSHGATAGYHRTLVPLQAQQLAGPASHDRLPLRCSSQRHIGSQLYMKVCCPL
jgi:hypothetical protein